MTGIGLATVTGVGGATMDVGAGDGMTDWASGVLEGAELIHSERVGRERGLAS